MKYQIKSGAYQRSVTDNKTHNITAALPEALAAQAAEMMKSRYNLEFLGIEQAVKEREFETQLVDNLQRFLLELGYGFCFNPFNRSPPNRSVTMRSRFCACSVTPVTGPSTSGHPSQPRF